MEKKLKFSELSKRSPNWSESERDVLVTNIIANYSKLFGKFSNTVSQQSKEALWSSIAVMVNSQSCSSNRTVAHCKKQWIDLKSAAKKQAAIIYKNLKKTGGGERDEEMLDSVLEKISTCENWSKKIVRLIGEESFAGIEDGIDFSAVLHKRQPDELPSTAISSKRIRNNQLHDENFSFGSIESDAQVPSVSNALCPISEESRQLTAHYVLKPILSYSDAAVQTDNDYKRRFGAEKGDDRKFSKEMKNDKGSVAEKMLGVQENILVQMTTLNDSFARMVKAVEACSERLGPVFFTK